MKKSLTLLLALFLAFGFAGVASAHVVVSPSEAPQNSYQVFTIRIPTESESASTTQVKLEVPEGVDVSRFQPFPDWTYELERNNDGKIVSVTWKASGQGLSPTEFGQFSFQGKVAENAGDLTWKAHQTYSDGTVVDWTGAADADKPASVTKVTPAVAGDAHGHGTGAAETASNKDGGSDPLTLGLAIAGLVAGVLALIVALVRKKSA
ncbi:YcnI family copper-binding membrane protein [Cohnella nanjingensis]|uniref:YcnI family protein n=1 Tax=Cohnella nanjingensis TaxID=1387779 RepID=A0A7X0RLU8_9BACL|nr:YcnI family protein [Cohnella nanjingensis]MBB6669726.1 YcnI family protein [Cohnella nanjingensis]